MEGLATLSEEELVLQYIQATQERDAAIEKIFSLEDEHCRRNLGAVALQWLASNKEEESTTSIP